MFHVKHPTRKVTMLYTLTMPGALYHGLMAYEAMHNDNDNDRAAVTVMKAAASCVVRTRGCQHILTGERKVLVYITDYVHSFIGLIESGTHSAATDLGTTTNVLRTFADRRPVPQEPQ